MIEYQLTKANRIELSRAFKNVKRIDIAIDSVIEGQMGRAFTDDAAGPTTFKLQIGPFCYFAGKFESAGAIDMLKHLEPYSLIMVCPERAIDIARELHGERLIRLPRYSFSSEKISLEHVCDLLNASSFRSRISRIDKKLLEDVSGQPDHFLDISCYETAEDFLARGFGYCQTENDKLTAVAYASLVSNTSIEVSIYVEPEYRRRGVATALACALIRDCLERNIDPHWDAANIESCTLAEKLGYVQSGIYDAFYIRP